MWLKRLALAGVFGCLCFIGGCVSEDQAAHEPTAKSQQITNKAYPPDSAYSRDIKDQKAVEQDEKNSKG